MNPPAKKNIIIAGAGFGGITAALKLAKGIGSYSSKYQIILVDRYRHQLYTPALYEIAAIPREHAPDDALKTSILIPIADIVEGRRITFVCDEVAGLRKENQEIILKNNGILKYEFLILALGSETNFFNIPGLKKCGFPLKTYNDAQNLRNTLEDALLKDKALKVVVAGGGSTGIELVSEFVGFVCALKAKVLPKTLVCNIEFILIEAADEILKGYPAWTIKKIKNRLEKLGVKVKTDAVINSVAPDIITLQNGQREPYDFLIWAGGVRGPDVLKSFGLPLSNKASLLIDEFLNVKDGDKNIFALGDSSTFLGNDGVPLPWNVPVAESEGRIAAKNILRLISGLPPKKFKPLKKYPYIITVGGRYAVADLIFFRFSGILGLAVKALVELRYLLSILPLKKALITWFRAVRYYSSNN